MRPQTWVLTGGPCAGKSTVLAAIKRQYGDRVEILPEIATTLFNEGHPQPGRDCEYSAAWQAAFQTAVLKRQIEEEDKVFALACQNGAELIVCDRGIMDGAAYVEGGVQGFAREYAVDVLGAHARYDRVIHLVSTAVCRPEKYGTAGNASRYEPLETAAAVEYRTREAWDGHAAHHVIDGAKGIRSVRRQTLALVGELLDQEVERKFRFSGSLPALPEGVALRQGYLPVEKGEMRLRREGGRTVLTVKGDGTLSRGEWEPEIPAWAFDQLWPQTYGRRIEKRRHQLRCRGTKDGISVDIYEAGLEGLVTLEAEFTSLKQAEAFSLPAWAVGAVEVTDDPRYKNKNLAKHGLPAD